MNYYTIPPPSQLSNYVRCFWVLEGGGPYTHRSMADGCAEMVFHYKAVFDEITSSENIESSFTASLSGPSQVYRRFVTHENFGIFGVYLYPYAIPQMFSIPTTELSNQMPDFGALLGGTGQVLANKIFEASSNAVRVKIMTEFLEKRLHTHEQKERAIVSVIHKIVHSEGVAGVQALAQKAFLSTRQFERKFKDYSGFNPKLFSRIIRFQSAIRKYGNTKQSLTAIAYDCGYYDQSHFIHDFKEFSGFHPRQYFKGNNEGTAWKEE
ncbi:MAG: helix-turn-helix domain-containing protein [Bacteroidota bacterium]